MGAPNGAHAALLVQSGWSGVNDFCLAQTTLSRPNNPKADPAQMVADLGTLFGVTQTTLKKMDNRGWDR
jgi:hypothetical protein